MLLEILKLLCAALLSALLGGYLVTRYKSREDNVEKRLDELCDEIDRVANLASSYWQLPPSHQDVPILAAKVNAGLFKIAGLRAALSDFVSASASKEMAEAESILLRNTTGEGFGVHNRVEDLQTATQVFRTAATYTVAVRKARLKDIKGYRRRS